MGIDVYLKWDGQTEQEQEAQITGFRTDGAVGYLRGAYFGGFSDVMHQLLDWANWDEAAPMNCDAMQAALDELKANGGERPRKGRWDGTVMEDRQNTPVPDEYIAEYQKFIDLARQLEADGKHPMVDIQ